MKHRSYTMELRMKYALWAIAAVMAGCADPTIVSNGDRVGVVTKLSHKRLSCGQWSWEGELAMAGGTNAAGQGSVDEGGNRSAVGIWQFSINPQSKTEESVAQLRDAMNTGHTVRLGYHQVNQHGCDTGTDYMVDYAADLAKQ